MRHIKICFAASSGGHFEQLMMLKPLMNKYDSFVVKERLKFDEYYANNWSIWLDLTVLIKTVRAVLGHEGAQ